MIKYDNVLTWLMGRATPSKRRHGSSADIGEGIAAVPMAVASSVAATVATDAILVVEMHLTDTKR